jgi:2-oxoglutarate dehydrogenase E2 component (dihydrolipoamide succinyltransferase)
MPTKIVVPELGESIFEATVSRWLKQEGDPVKVGEPVVELETDKVNLEVSAEHAGVLVSIERGEGEDVEIGEVLAMIEEAPKEGEEAPAKEETTQAEKKAETAEEDIAKTEGEPSQPEKEVSKAEETASEAKREAPGEAKERATPVARRLAQDEGIDLAQVQTSRSDGRVTKQDVQTYIKQHEAEPKEEPTPSPLSSLRGDRQISDEERVRLSRRRQTIARRLVEAQHTAAMLTTFNEIDMGAVMALRQRRQKSFQERYGVKLGISSFFVKASIGALKNFPHLNAEIQEDEMVLKHYYDIGIAIGAEEGLVVPVLRDADRMSFAEIEKVIKDYARQAQEGTLSLEDLRGGTFTITNGGVFGSLLSTPILNPPQVGILGLHKIEERPIVHNGEVEIRPMMYVALSYDHRIVDGREAVQFLVRIKALIEDPETLLLEG